MKFNWFQSILYGFLSGLSDIVPVSAQAHKVLLLKFLGVGNGGEMVDLFVHLGVFLALYFCNQAQLIRMSRARRLSQIPKRKRKRPLDVRSMMDLSLLKTMLIPAVLGMIAYQYTEDFRTNLLVIALFLFVNGIILYIPQFLPTGNRDSRTLSRVEGLLMGLGGAVSVLPGISCVGSAVSIASVCGIERVFSLNMALLLNMFVMIGYIVYDILAVIAGGIGVLSFVIVLRYIVIALCSFVGALLGVRGLQRIASGHGFSAFGLYCFGLSLFTFILNLIA